MTRPSDKPATVKRPSGVKFADEIMSVHCTQFTTLFARHHQGAERTGSVPSVQTTRHGVGAANPEMMSAFVYIAKPRRLKLKVRACRRERHECAATVAQVRLCLFDVYAIQPCKFDVQEVVL